MESLPGEILELISEVHKAPLTCISNTIATKLSAKKFSKRKRSCIRDARAEIEARIDRLSIAAPEQMGMFRKLYAANLLVDGAPEPPTLGFMDWIADVTTEMLGLFEEKGSRVLHAAMTRRRLYWIGGSVEVFKPTLGRENAEAIKLFGT